MPKDATVNGDGFRMYRWAGGDTELNRRYKAVEPSDLLSVTSIKTLAGEPWQLVNWKINNVVNLAMGTRKVVRIGPRGGVKEVYVKDGPFPGEFVHRMQETGGGDTALGELRKWLKQTADDPRDIAAVRGSVVHKMIEVNLRPDLISEAVIRNRFDAQWSEERRKVKPDVTEEDVNFADNAMRQYWDMRLHVPFVIIAQEPQVFNLTVGYAGSTDVLMWFLGHFEEDGAFIPLPGFDPATEQGRARVAALQALANQRKLTQEKIESIGGTTALGDWKTAKGIYTNHVIQATAYMAGEFVAYNGLIDERLTAILNAIKQGVLIHIRPDRWGVDFFDLREDVLLAFMGSVVFARMLAVNKSPVGLFSFRMDGQAPGTEESEEVDDDAA